MSLTDITLLHVLTGHSDIQKWEFLIEEGNRLRREVKMIADEYDVEWDETKDEGDHKVVKALREERKKDKKKKEKEEEDDEDEDDDTDDATAADKDKAAGGESSNKSESKR